MNGSALELELLRYTEEHFKFLIDIGYTGPVQEQRKSSFFLVWTDLTYSAPSLDRSCSISLFSKQDEGSIQISLTRNDHLTNNDFLDFHLYLAAHQVPFVPWSFPLTGGSGNELLDQCKSVIRLNAQALRGYGGKLIDGSDWEAGHYQPMD